MQFSRLKKAINFFKDNGETFLQWLNRKFKEQQMKINPYDKREKKDDKKAFTATKNTVKPVAKDTNKTRRKNTLKPLKNAIKKKTAESQGRREKKGIR